LWGQCGVEIRPYAIQPDLENTDCWQFTGSLDAYGYGRLYSGNKEVKAHRVFHEAFEGPLPDGKYLQHHLPRSDAPAMPTAIRTISSSTIRQGVGIQLERNTVPRRPSSGPLSTLGEESHQESYVVADVPGSRRVPRRQRRFRDLSWVVQIRQTVASRSLCLCSN
jgi:hypothetical protein